MVAEEGYFTTNPLYVCTSTMFWALWLYDALLLSSLHWGVRSRAKGGTSKARAAITRDRRLSTQALVLWFMGLAFVCRAIQEMYFYKPLFWGTHWFAMAFFLLSKVSLMVLFNTSMTAITKDPRWVRTMLDIIYGIFVVFILTASAVVVAVTLPDLEKRSWGEIDIWEEANSAIFFVAAIYFFGTSVRFLLSVRKLRRQFATAGVLASNQIDKLRSGVRVRVLLLSLYACSFALRGVQILSAVFPPLGRNVFGAMHTQKEAISSTAVMIAVEVVPGLAFFILMRKSLPHPLLAVRSIGSALLGRLPSVGKTVGFARPVQAVPALLDSATAAAVPRSGTADVVSEQRPVLVVALAAEPTLRTGSEPMLDDGTDEAFETVIEAVSGVACGATVRDRDTMRRADAELLPMGQNP